MARAAIKPLIISEQPPSLFWKDRGGKRNMLRIVVESPIPLRQALPLRILLFNDAGEAVEENTHAGDTYGKKIFVTHKSSYELTPESPAVEVLFRIERVSSKIGLFKLYIEPDYGDGIQGPIGGVFTDNIEVKSKVNDKAKAQYIDSIQNILVPAAPHAAGGGPASAAPPVSGPAMPGRLSEPPHAAHGTRGHHGGSAAVGAALLAAVPPAHHHLHHQVSESSFVSSSAVSSTSARASHAHHSRAEGGGSAAERELRRMLHQLGATVGGLQAQLQSTLNTVDYKMLLLHRRLAAVEVHLNITPRPAGGSGGGPGGDAAFDGVRPGAGGAAQGGAALGLGPAISNGGHFRRESTAEAPDHLMPPPHEHLAPPPVGAPTPHLAGAAGGGSLLGDAATVLASGASGVGSLLPAAMLGSPVFGGSAAAFQGAPLSISASAGGGVPVPAHGAAPGALQPPTGIMSWQDSAGQQQVMMYQLQAAAPVSSAVTPAAAVSGPGGASEPRGAATAPATAAVSSSASGSGAADASGVQSVAAAPAAPHPGPLQSALRSAAPASTSSTATAPRLTFAAAASAPQDAASAAKGMMQGPPSVYDSLFVVGSPPSGTLSGLGAGEAPLVFQGVGGPSGAGAGHDAAAHRPRTSSFSGGANAAPKRRYSVAAEDFTIDAGGDRSFDAAAAASKRMRSFSAFSSGSNFFSAHPPYMPGSSPFDEDDGRHHRGDSTDEDDGMGDGAAVPERHQQAHHRYGTRGAATGGVLPGSRRQSFDERDEVAGLASGRGSARPRSNSRVSVGKSGGQAALPANRALSRSGSGPYDGAPALLVPPGPAIFPEGSPVSRVTSAGALTDLDTDEHVADALAMLGAAVGPIDSTLSSARGAGGAGVALAAGAGAFSAGTAGAAVQSDSSEGEGSDGEAAKK